MERSYIEADIFLVVYDTLDKDLCSIFVAVKSNQPYYTKIITQALQKMKATKIHEMIFWYEGHIRNNPIFLEDDEQYDGAFALKIEYPEDTFLVEEVLMFDVTFSNERDLVFRRKIILPKNMNFQLIEKEIREMYWKVKEIQTISLTV